MLNVEKQIDQYFFYCQYERNLSSKTIQAYRIDLKQFKSFLNEHEQSPGKDVSRIDKHILKEYIREITEKNKPKTVKRKIATLKAFFSYMEFEDIILLNPFRKIRISINEGRQLPRTISLSIIKKLIHHLYKQKESFAGKTSYSYKALIRDIAVIETLFAAGLRVSELCNLQKSDLDLAKGSLRIKGKGNKERIVPICTKETKEALSEYFIMFRQEIENYGFFFVNRLGNRLSDQSVRFMIKKYAKELNIDQNITPHMFRHSIATLFLENEVDTRYIQKFLGHSSINTTQIYLQVKQDAQRRILSRKHPRKVF